MARSRLDHDQTRRLEDELIRIFQANPSEPYRSALHKVYETYPEFEDIVAIDDLNYRIPKLRRAGRIPASQRGAGSRATSANGVQTHPVARAYQELDEAKQELDRAQERFDEAEEHLRLILRDSLPPDFIESLRSEQI